MEVISRVSTHAGQNRVLCVSTHGCLPGTLPYLYQNMNSVLTLSTCEKYCVTLCVCLCVHYQASCYILGLYKHGAIKVLWRFQDALCKFVEYNSSMTFADYPGFLHFLMNS